jgi:hypothetical protein
VRWDLGYCCHYWPNVPAPDDRWGWLWRNWWNEDWQGKPKYSEKTCPSTTLSTTIPTWLDPGLNPGRRGSKTKKSPYTFQSYRTISRGSHHKSKLLIGRPVAQAVCRWFPTAAARVPFRTACGVCGGQSGTWMVFFEYFGFPCQSFHQFLYYHIYPGLAQ